ncbi:hypothetical protein IPN35_04365 [Candidatus Peregrinibacteria bacterium]|nr:MAG: hypothetical protein IPN35_04365 [Candidatus Peregrinibacteria bacterium]
MPKNERRYTILRAIVQNFIETASPVGSRALQESFGFGFSPATIRSEMSILEEEGFLRSPHTSAGRIPTEHGFRHYVSTCQSDLAKLRPSVEREFTQHFEQYLQSKAQDENVYDAVNVLTALTPNVAFSTIPSADRMFFLGFSNALQQPEFSEPGIASGIFRVLENNFRAILDSLEIAKEPRIFIGSENAIPEIQSCSLIVSMFFIGKKREYIGILGPMRMNYIRNIAAVESATEFLQYR